MPECMLSRWTETWAKLNAARLRTLTEAGDPPMATEPGLYLQVRGAEQRSWRYRFKLHGKPHLMGLGTIADVSLAEARDAATAARKLVRQGIDPIAQRRAERADVAGRAGLNTFAEVAVAYIAAHAASWRNAKHRQQWRNTLDTYAQPVLGNLGVAMVDTGAVMRVLEPIWREKPETASRLRGRIESVLDYATARGWRTGDNPARWRGHPGQSAAVARPGLPERNTTPPCRGGRSAHSWRCWPMTKESRRWRCASRY